MCKNGPVHKLYWHSLLAPDARGELPVLWAPSPGALLFMITQSPVLDP